MGEEKYNPKIDDEIIEDDSELDMWPISVLVDIVDRFIADRLVDWFEKHKKLSTILGSIYLVGSLACVAVDGFNTHNIRERVRNADKYSRVQGNLYLDKNINDFYFMGTDKTFIRNEIGGFYNQDTESELDKIIVVTDLAGGEALVPPITITREFYKGDREFNSLERYLQK